MLKREDKVSWKERIIIGLFYGVCMICAVEMILFAKFERWVLR